MPQLLVILTLPAVVALLAVMFVVSVGMVGAETAMVDGRALLSSPGDARGGDEQR